MLCGPAGSGVRRGRARLTVVGVVAALVAVLVGPQPRGATSPPEPSRPVPPPERPNVVLVVTDDLDVGTLQQLPGLRDLFTGHGTAFTRAYATDALCCPARTSILRGQYVHNHGVLDNSGPDGGYPRFAQQRLGQSTVGTWLHDAGYRTALLGKFLNAYPRAGAPTAQPPGWDVWRAGVRFAPYRAYDYTLVENGRRVRYGSQRGDHAVDVLARKAEAFARSSGQRRRPFFLYLAPYAPHGPATPPRRYADALSDAPLPASARVRGEEGQPWWLRRLPGRPDARQQRRLEGLHRDRLRSMLAVEDMVRRLVRTLRATGQLDETYLVFTADHGYHLGQHGLGSGKRTAFEEDVHVPLYVRGPGVPAGREVPALASTVDLAPTFADLAGARTPDFVDGRSLVPMLHGDDRPSDWRRSVLVEHSENDPRGALDPDLVVRSGGSDTVQVPSYAAVRTRRYTYVDYADGSRALYDNRRDPYQRRNLAGTSDARVRRLAATLRGLVDCEGAGCRRADRSGP